MISLIELANKLKSEKRVALICHVRPDGDSLGSALALKLALCSEKVEAEVVCDDLVPSRFFFLEQTQTVKRSLDGEYSALIAIDCADLTRLGKLAEQFNKHPNTIVIDHHVSNNRYAKINYVLDVASNCENMFNLIKQSGMKLDKQTADLLMMGVMTDTGCFKHKNVTEETFRVASELKALGADVNLIYYHMFSAQTKERAMLFGITMQKLRYFLSGKFVVATIMLSDLEKSGAKQDETEGFIDFIMGIKGVEIGACIMETAKNKFKISFRSHEVDVNAVAGRFGGGGHSLASGCQISGEYEEVVDKITFAVSRELPE